MAPLSAVQLQQLERDLRRLHGELTQQLQIGEQASAPVTLDQTLVGRVSRMDAMQQQSMAVATQDKARMKLQKVERALRAFQEGEYGLCRHCEEDIDIRRLQAQPESLLCIACQGKLDGEQ